VKGSKPRYGQRANRKERADGRPAKIIAERAPGESRRRERPKGESIVLLKAREVFADAPADVAAQVRAGEFLRLRTWPRQARNGRQIHCMRPSA